MTIAPKGCAVKVNRWPTANPRSRGTAVSGGVRKVWACICGYHVALYWTVA